MRFGLFIPQGWRLDLVDIPPERQWDVMRELAQYDAAYDRTGVELFEREVIPALSDG
ncbi:MAG TPA: hypothetical protein VH496_17070 [Mycobacterium sp.]|jgi:hypothetical protein